MPRAALTFRKGDVARAIESARKAGLPILRIDIAKNGTISMHVKDGEPLPEVPLRPSSPAPRAPKRA